MNSSQPQYVLAIDQGTTSTRAMLVDHAGRMKDIAQREHAQIFPKAGWVEHDAAEVWENTQIVLGEIMAELGGGNATKQAKGGEKVADNPGSLKASPLIAAIGITNQRETTVIWEKSTGKPLANAIVWQDTRTQKLCDEFAGAAGPERFLDRCGLPFATYFAGPKISWLLDSLPGARARAEKGEILAGTMDSWIAWNLTGGPQGGEHVTDVTNASRTMLMDLHSLHWDEELCAHMRIPPQMLPRIVPCSGPIGRAASTTAVSGLPITGMIGDQQAATFGQACFEVGQGKNTYGTGCFLLMNTGTKPVRSQHGLLTTVAYQIANQPAVYALEGSVAVAGSLVQWLRDNLGVIKDAAEVNELAATVADNGGAYFVPAFSGLFAPHWRADARGVVAGLTRFVNRGHLARAVLEASAYQTREVVEAMEADAGTPLQELNVDGGMVASDLLMQEQADLLGVSVISPVVTETTALGAAYAAGIAVGFWEGTADVIANWQVGKRWEPDIRPERQEVVARNMRNWRKAVQRTLDWVDDDSPQE